MTTKTCVAGVFAAVVLAAAAGCSGSTEQAATSSISAPSTPGSAGAALLGSATQTGPQGVSGPGTSTAPAIYLAIPIDSLPFPESGRAPFSAVRQAALQAVLDTSVADPAAVGVQGVTAAVVSPEGSWAGAAGVDGAAVPLVPTSMGDIASVTKTVTAAEVLHLAGAGLVDIDAPASDYLNHPLLQRQPTVRQLLSHTSGVPDFDADPAFFAAKDADPNRHWTTAEVLAYATGPIKDPGGKEIDYSNSNYLLLGLLIEKITGLSYAEAVHRDVLAGLGDRMVVQDAESPTLPLAVPDPLSGTVFDGHFLPNRSTSSAVGSAARSQRMRRPSRPGGTGSTAGRCYRQRSLLTWQSRSVTDTDWARSSLIPWSLATTARWRPTRRCSPSHPAIGSRLPSFS